MNQPSWAAFAQGHWYNWKPLPGLDPGLGEAMYWLGAAKWASSMAEGKPEAIAHQEAEVCMMETAYGLLYTNSVKSSLSNKHHNRKEK